MKAPKISAALPLDLDRLRTLRRSRVTSEAKKPQPIWGAELVAIAAIVGMFALFIWNTLLAFATGVLATSIALSIAQSVSRAAQQRAQTNQLLVTVLETRGAKDRAAQSG